MDNRERLVCSAFIGLLINELHRAKIRMNDPEGLKYLSEGISVGQSFQDKLDRNEDI